MNTRAIPAELTPIAFDPHITIEHYHGAQAVDSPYHGGGHEADITRQPLGLGAVATGFEQLAALDTNLVIGIKSAAHATPQAKFLDFWARHITAPGSNIVPSKKHHGAVTVSEKAPMYFVVNPVRDAKGPQAVVTRQRRNGNTSGHIGDDTFMLLPGKRMQDPNAVAEPMDVTSDWARSVYESLSRRYGNSVVPVCVTVNLENVDSDTRTAILEAASTKPRSGQSLLGEYVQEHPDDDIEYEMTVIVPMQLNLAEEKQNGRTLPAQLPRPRTPGLHRAGRTAPVTPALAPAATAATAAIASEALATPAPEEQATAEDQLAYPDQHPDHAAFMSTLPRSSVDQYPRHHDKANRNQGVAVEDEAAMTGRREVYNKPISKPRRILAALMSLVLASNPHVGAIHHQPHDPTVPAPLPTVSNEAPSGPDHGHAGGERDQPFVAPHTDRTVLWSAFKDGMTTTHDGHKVVPQAVTAKLNTAIDWAKDAGYKVTVVDDTTGKVVGHLGAHSHFSVTDVVTPDGKHLTDVDSQYGALVTVLHDAGITL